MPRYRYLADGYEYEQGRKDALEDMRTYLKGWLDLTNDDYGKHDWVTMVRMVVQDAYQKCGDLQGVTRRKVGDRNISKRQDASKG